MILDAIVAKKRQRLEWEKQKRGMADLRRAVEYSERNGDKKKHPDYGCANRSESLYRQIYVQTNTETKTFASSEPFIIAEIKKASPSKGAFELSIHVDELTKIYTSAGASCISVVTEVDFFLGDKHLFQQVYAATHLPLLRKDFIIDPYQVYETREMKAALILLIAAIVSREQLKELVDLSHKLGLIPLVEVHTTEDLEKALGVEADIIGINNRNLKNFETNLDTTRALLPHIPADKTVVSESGIKTREDILKLQKMNEKGNRLGVLVGESLLKSDYPGQKIRALKGAGQNGDGKILRDYQSL